MRNARRSASSLGATRVYARVLGSRAAPQLESFPCGLLCMECRFLADPPRGGDPMRVDAEQPMRQPCPRCGATSWSDLRNRDTARFVDEIDAYETEERRARLRRRLVHLAVVAALAVAGLASTAVATPSHGWFGTIGALIALALVVAPVLASPAGASTRTPPRTQPSRWHMVSPRAPRRRGTPRSGPLLTDAPLTAPLTGRPCVGYEIGVRADGKSCASPSTWALLEQRSAEGRVDGLELAADQAYLRLRRTRIGMHEVEPEHRARFLRARGLEPSDAHVVYETIIPVGASCRVWPGGSGCPPILEHR